MFDNNSDYHIVTTNRSSSYVVPYNDEYENQTYERQHERINIIAQPKAFYRARYACETDHEKQQVNRFIQAENNERNYLYPIIQVFIHKPQ